MACWRMAFRVGSKGPSMWPHCLRWGVAAITYNQIAHTDLSKLPEDKAYSLWSELQRVQKPSLKSIVYEMNAGDLIYVKEGPDIISRGRIRGKQGTRAYRFDHSDRIIDTEGLPWKHQVPVEWATDFYRVHIQVGTNQRFTVQKLTDADAKRIELAEEAARKAARKTLNEEKYYRQSTAQRKLIIPRHKKLSNAFCRWLQNEYGVQPILESDQVDVRFYLNSRAVLAEVEVSLRCGTTKSIREALGQLLEYNHYPHRSAAEDWLIVLDKQPSRDDQHYIKSLRRQYSLPLFIGWQSGHGFDFPYWPPAAASD